METKTVMVAGYDQPLPLYRVKLEDGSERVLAQIGRLGTDGFAGRSRRSADGVKAPIETRTPVREVSFALENYKAPFQQFDFLTFLKNSVFVTVVATIITLIFNSMAAFVLAKYEFKGRGAVLPSSW